MNWLPSKIYLSASDGDWDSYINEIYQVFKHDFVVNKPSFKGSPLALKRHPIKDGKERTFWHIISDGDDEDSRILNEQRCERISWPAPIINHSNEDCIRCWSNVRKKEKRILLWFVPEDYLVVLAQRTGFTLFWTAYPIEHAHTRSKLTKEYSDWIKAGGTL